jgi:hypothetical protein
MHQILLKLETPSKNCCSPSPQLFAWISRAARHDPQIGARRFPALRGGLLGVFIGNRARDDHFLPVSVTQLPSRLKVLEGLRREDSIAELIATFFSLEPDQTRFRFTTFRSSQRLNYELAI